MYWAYLILFVCMIVTPEIIQDGVLFFSEEDFESLLIFCFGLLGLLLYLGKESAFLRAVREKLSLQQETNKIRKDLSQTYSYIGEMNRRMEILKSMVVTLSHRDAPLLEREGHERYHPILEAALLLAQTDSAALFFIDVKRSEMLEQYEIGGDEFALSMRQLSAKNLIESHKYLWEEGSLFFVRSPEAVGEVVAFLVFHKSKNQLEEAGIFQILAAQAIFVYSLNGKSERGSAESKSSISI